MAQEEMRLAWADGEYVFRFPLVGIKEIEEKCNAGIGAVWSRLASSRLNHLDVDAGSPLEARFRIQDIIEPIRQGLIGGGLGVVDGETIKVNSLIANRLIENYVIGRPLQESWSVAYAIVGGLIEGFDPPKKKAEDQATETGDLTMQEP